MKKGKVLKRLFPISLCAVLLILSVGCTSTTPTSTSVESIPLFLRYVDAVNNQEQLLKLTWNTKTGTVEMDTSTTLMFPNYANESNFWVRLSPWIGLSSQPPKPVSNTAIYWDGSDTATLFTTEKDLFVGLQENNLKANIVSLTSTSMCNQYFNMTNCYTTPNKLYTFEQDLSNSTIYRFSSTEAVKTTVSGYAMGVGAEGSTTYVLSASETQSSTGPNSFLNIQFINADGSLIEKKVANSERKEPYSLLSDAGGWAAFANGNFYSNTAKVNASSDSPKFELVQSLADAFEIISTSTSLGSFGGPYPSPAFYGYKGYTIVVGSTFSPDEITVALLNDEKLVAFVLITPIDTAETNFVTYDATGKQLNTYSIQTPLQVVVPQS
ncbi:hypothetical protein COPRO5265_1540 [Coprothermobacter proteolyticus DSM 5265]|uniref:Lipoprotein n=1 Tax=Coprothermobacter proteolyticus (strain ATCC 35245 / DSM 5265 / OCM 4 / BT) TaxID=309798 RepID=B5Y6B8_COPPD|nr:hypothetical protein [Coprothermobacter proteolyticus]ACI17112.1 hypothetical protein COPRO5265_1540 [Coprothermobacter proteolyticus DSM 5265]